MADEKPQNIYDDPAFFAGYSTLERFGAGWERAAEHADLLALLPAVDGRRVLDLGCGAGQLARHLATTGAAEVVGIDVSERMLALARAEWAHPRVTYRREAIEEAKFSAGTEHPIFTARLPGDGWVIDDAGRRTRWSLDCYADEGVREETWFDDSGVPNVIGVRTESGERVLADLVVDAMGRRSPLPTWLEDVGAEPLHEEAEPSGFVYYTRYFRSRDGIRPQPRDRLLTAVGSFSVLTLPGDNETWSVTLFGSSADRPLTQLHHETRWTAVVAACPLHAHWLVGEAVTGVLPMAGVLDRHRRLVTDGRPSVTGLAAVADAWACTNPSLGRGIALGLAHAARLRDVARTELDDPHRFALAWDRVTETELTPWYRTTVAVDRARLAEIEAIRTGSERRNSTDPGAVLGADLGRAMPHDPDIFRAFMEIAGLTLPSVIFKRPGFADRVLEVAARHAIARPPGPTREELLRLIV